MAPGGGIAQQNWLGVYRRVRTFWERKGSGVQLACYHRAFVRAPRPTACSEADSTMRRHVVTLAMGALLTVSATAHAQNREWTERGFVNLGFGFQGSAGDIEDSRDRAVNLEQERITSSIDTDAGPFFDIGGGARVWRNVSVGVSFNRVSGDGNATITGASPNPLFFDRPRNFTAEARGLQRTERGFHISVGYMFIVNDQLDVHVQGGPSFFNVSQEVVSDVTIAETGGAPLFTSVTGNPVIAEVEESPVGAHIGADVTYKLLTRDAFTLGGGVFLRYAGASADIPVLANAVSTDVGGFQFGFGLRTRF